MGGILGKQDFEKIRNFGMMKIGNWIWRNWHLVNIGFCENEILGKKDFGKTGF